MRGVFASVSVRVRTGARIRACHSTDVPVNLVPVLFVGYDVSRSCPVGEIRIVTGLGHFPHKNCSFMNSYISSARQ